MAKKGTKKAGRRKAKSKGLLETMFGISDSGIKAGRLATGAGVLSLMLMPGWKQDNINYSPLNILMGRGPFAAWTMGQRAELAYNVARNMLYGHREPGWQAQYLPYEKMAGYMIGGGITASIVGRWINRYLGGSFIKL
jgi:hypothetical protein